MNLKDYGFTPDLIPDSDELPARVTAVHRERYTLASDNGEIYGRLKSKEYYDGNEAFPTAGDFVLVNYNPDGDSQIVRTLPRRTLFTRRDPTPGRGMQAVAANFDYVFILQSLNHDFNERRLERYLALAWDSGALPVVLLTKSDLVSDYGEYLRRAEKLAVGTAVYAVSSRTKAGLDSLVEYLRPGKTIVLLGSSGVGKSSFVNSLAGEDIMAVNEIREDDSRGRHTTTHRQLIMLKNGVMIIDTPGMRELGLGEVTDGLDEAFSDVGRYIGRCKYRDCTHTNEPGCAILAAIERGELTRERWESYKSLGSESEYTDDKLAYLRKKQQRNKDIAKLNRQREKRDKRHGNDRY